MKRFACALVLLFCVRVYAQQELGSLCLSPKPDNAPSRCGLACYSDPATLELKIDNKVIGWRTDKAVTITGFNPTERHRVVVSADGKALQSFRFRFSDHASNRLCLAFDAYGGLQLYSMVLERKRAKVCGCTCPDVAQGGN